MTYMLDSNICIYAINNRNPKAARQITVHRQSGICISAIAFAELRHGVEKSAYPEKNTARLLQLTAIMDVLPFGKSAAEEYGRIRACLQKRGTPIGPMDMLIAAHARAENLILVTINVREFARVPDLKLENWAE